MVQQQLSDIDIAQSTELLPIQTIAQQLNLKADQYECYGRHKAKVSIDVLKDLQHQKPGHIVLVTSINPTASGEGKSTLTVGLGQALNKIGKNAVIALREPSLGPVMGMKGGAAGGGYSQILPMEDINLHFTGDLHAITSAHNLLAALIDNHIHQGNSLHIDPQRIVWKRVLDLNDRALRQMVIGLGGPANGTPREDGFDITVASEIMAILCLAMDLEDLKARLSRIVIAYSDNKEPITVKDLGAEGALTVLLKDAIHPNLVQTIEHTPAFVHGGPFANIAHGCSSLVATMMAAKLADYCVTEAGFGADLGAEKFLDIKMRTGDLKPSAVVIVATVRALKMHGGVAKSDLQKENLEALQQGVANLKKHMETISHYGLPYVIAINRFTTDTEAELAFLIDWCKANGARAELANVWEEGGQGGIALAEAVVAAIDQESNAFQPLYALHDSIEEKINQIVKKVYGGGRIEFSATAKKQLQAIAAHGWEHLPICIAKTQYSLSDDPTKVGRPEGFTIHIRELVPRIGAGFIVVMTGSILTMPGLPKQPATLNIGLNADGQVEGLF
ncbi:formate--tetrahydrofolate ligase [Pullulanibacillus camelliae]|uniref:Formate--tetrahydrofolate ligase n=1 Tax=Pullulanibacillus camelliae TaxID=1707096 RepID=A0A8J2VMV8_9BACL|nr:formate--tetrahydrofolate ligase [Pullulanibacillus camelliae]GGE39375.1 formate--tetrahydrofolate ligase [Pullulanibacillus camelliae]